MSLSSSTINVEELFHLQLTFCQRGARNSFNDIPISPYVMSEIQNPQLNQGGKEAAKENFLSTVVLSPHIWSKMTYGLTYIVEE